uniref:Leucine-rich repeat domain containing protein n=1 Tax=Haemonchus contortus TaxID=6289 RepID=A0A7I5E6B8_HAECO
MSRLIHLHFNKFLLLLVIWSSSVAADDCPILPSTCVCNKEATGRISITCDGAHLPSLFKDIGGASIDRLRISKCAQPVVDVLPTGPIRSLALTNCQITTINPEIFRSVESTLEELNLSNNSLKNVPLLGNMSQLRSLNLFGNKVKEVPEGVFSGLSQLRMLRLENNEICSLSPTSLSEVKQKIELLDLSGNCFASVPAQALRNSIKLMYLDLSDNKISEINNFELMNLPQLKELRLQNNQLHEIHPMAFMNVPQLQYLYLKDNLIGSLDGNRLQAFHRLEILDVTNNLLLKLPELKDLTSLKQVRLDGNLIEKIDTLAFSNNPNLQLISIQDNNIAQIAKNSFDSLDQLMVLLLSNNSIQKLERGMLDGMRNLQQLNLRNNSLTAVDEYSFASLRFLTTLDLAHNELVKIGKRTFSHQSKLFWLDLSNNKLTGFEEGTFDTKIANLLLDGNHLICDDDFDWFVRYLVTNRVRTFLPFQTEITCAGPEKYAGVRLKDLMIKKANDTLTEGMRSLGFNSDQSQNSLLSALLPGFRPPPAASANGGGALGQAAAGLPILSTLSQAIPSMRNMPGLDMTAAAAAAGGAQPANPNLNTAIEQFTAPLVRFATGGQPVQSDIEQLIQSIPNFVVNVPGMGNVDISKLDPNLIAHVLRGGQIPGIPKETLDGIVQQYMLKMHEAAAAAQNGAPLKNGSKFLPPIEKFPPDIVASVFQGNNLPGLNEEQTKVIKDYYTARLPVPPAAVPERISAMANTSPVPYSTRNTTTAPPFVFSKELLDMLKILPVGYNLSKIPAEIITAFSRGEVPDLRKLPTDLIEHFKSNSEKLGLIFNRVAKANASLEEMLAKMPKFEKPVLSTFSPYDINHLSNDMIHEEEEAARAARMRVYTAIALGLVGAATVVILGFFAVYIKRQREAKERRGPMTTPRCAFPGAPLANSTMRNQPRSHSSSHLHLRTNT